MNFPDDLKYTKDHEWLQIDGNIITIGITDYAQDQLGDIVYVELPEVGQEYSKGDTFGVLESVKAVSDCYSPLTGKIAEVNSLLADSPEVVNEDCYGEGWIIKVEITDTNELGEAMDPIEYEALVKEETA